VGDVDPATQAYPALQLPTQAAVDCPVVFPNRPGLHSPLQPGVVSPPTPNVPTVQGPVHDALDMAAVVPYRPAAQFVHMPAPAGLNLPNGHTEAVGLVEPMPHA
jgi:hypothetical protein